MLFFKFVLLALSATLVAAGGCLFAPLPDNLNTPAFLGSRDEVSFQGTFQTDYSVSSQNIFFNVTTASFFRAYVSPLPLDVDLWLHTVPPDNTKTPVHSTLDIDTPETIATLLQPGAYRLRIDFIGFFVYDLPESLRTCPTLQLELAIVPQNTFQGRVSTDAACAVPGQQFPTIDFSPLLTSSSFVYDGSLNKTNNNAWRFKQENWTPLPAPEDVMLINRYRIEVPASHSATYWFIEVVLGVDFMSGGQYGVLLTTHDPHQQAGVKLPGGYDCLGNSSCVIGTARYNNEKFLKRLVSPGVYDLWLYERPSERVKSLTQQCTPFTLRVMIEESQEKETFVTCPAAPLPSSLSLDTQFGIDTSYAEGERFSSQILIDFSNPEQITRVDVKQLSILRAYADGGPVDVDLRLKDINTGKTIISSLSAGDDDLYAEIEAGSYNVTFKSFGDYEPTSCQTFQAVLQVESLAHAQDEDYCSRVSLQSPDLKDINVKLSAGQPYNSDPTHVFAVTSNTTEITTTTFTVPSNTSAVFYARAEHNFLFAPLMMQLSAQGKPSDSASRSLMSLDAATIDAILEPGTYSFSIELDKTHKPSSSSHLPSCAVFSLDLHVHKRDPISLDDQSDCWRIRTLPSTLQTPAHLLTSRSAHLADNFKVEFEANQLKYSEWMHIGQVPVKSLLRVVTSHSHIDLDVYLYNAGSNVSVDHSDSFDNNWESILFELDPSVDYKLKFVYYHWSHQSSGGVDDVDPPCFSFRLELAIEPTSYVPAPAPGQLTGSCMGGDHVLPGYTVEVEDDFDLDSAYRFAQSSQTLKSMQTLFVLDDASLFRATLSFDFIWHHLHLELYAAGNISALDDTSKTAPWRDNLVASGVAIFNGNNIGPLQLSAGSYVLVVRELRSHEAASVTSCARFRLHVGARSLDVQSGRVAVDPSEVELLRCSESRLGVAFDDVSHLSTRSGYRMHVFRQVLANKGNDELVEFQLTQESVFRLRAPLRRLFWLSIKLYNGTRDNLGARVNALGGFASHELLARLASGPYVLKISYLGRSSSLGEEDCPQFPLELAIEPIDSLKSLPALNPNGGCGDIPALPQLTSADLKGFSQKAVSHPLDKLEKITVELGEFNITKTTFLDASLDFDFLSGSLAWHLSGKLPRGSIGRYAYKTFDGSFGQGRALMQQVLLPGSYKLEIIAESGSKTAFQGAAICSPFDVSVATRTNNLPAYDCYNGDSLPSSAASYYSWAYGGPQDEDGEVVLFGDNFLLDGSDDASVDQYMDFVVKEASYVRFFVGAGDTDDIDFFLYKNSSLDELIGSSNSVGASESKLFFLQPQSDAYTLNLFFFYVDPQPPCRRFTFEMALRTVSTVHNELLCPNPLPNAALRVPPTSYRFDSTKQYGSDLYFFTSDLIESNTTSSFFSRTFRYRMDVSAPTGAVVKATVGFDFLVNDFKLELIDADTSVRVASSTRRPADDRSTYANFQSQLEYTLERGKNYHLDIIEDRSDLALKLENQTYCHKFAFHIDAGVSSTSDRAPHVFWVTPSSGEDINPLEPLAMSIYLSKGLKYDASVDPPLLSTIIANQAVYLQDEKTGAKIMAHTADVTRNNRRIHVTFNNGTLNIASTYKLHVNLNGPAFRSDESPPREFEAYTVEHTYKTVECDCNAPHGSCVKGENKYVCKCVAPFEGEDCKACGKGYHSAVTGCVADTKCTPSFCGEKGTCDDSRGYPQCQCHTGFATVGDEHCRACARGYWGHFPDCRKIGESLSRPPRCQAPLLPSTLNGIGGLGYDGQVHLQGDYYIDTLNYEHDITFTISIQSVFRVYVARHRIDIDIWLYELDSVGNIVDVVESGVGFGTEESIFLLLNGLRNQPKKYLLRFQYFDFGDFDLFGDIAESSGSGSDSTDCESFSFELAVVPVPNVADETLLSSKCVEKENLPLPALPNNTLTIEKDYSYAPNDYFTINALPTAAVDNTKARYAWERKIEIKEVEGQIAVLRASMRYRFAVGDLAFLLEHGDDVCKTKTAKEGNVNEEQDDDNVDFDDDELLDKTRCAVGTNHRNMHTIEQKLEPGVYTLRIYEPRPQLYSMTKCSVFHFELQVTYEKASESIFTCPGVQLPPNFNSPAYLAQADGQMHLVDTFSLNRYQRVEFELEKDSLFRWHSNGDAARVVLHGARRFATLTDGVDTSDSNGVYARLGAGNYSISISRRVYNTFCPSLVGELAIAPYKFPTCAGNAGIPSLSVTALPFRFNGTDSNGVPTTFNTRLSTSTTIASYPFELGEAADLRAELSSDFLTANMLLAVYHVADSLGTLAHIANGRNNYNHNTLRLLLAPGKYQLAIEIPARATVDTAPPYASCADFNFMFHLLPVHADAVDDCLAYRGEAEELPTTLDGARYFAAGKRDRIHFQSDQFLIPPAALNRFWHEHYINFTAPASGESLLRIYAEPRNDNDVDLKLFQDKIQVATASNRVYGDETFTARLSPGKNYRLRITFWSADNSAQRCPTFGMSVDIEPVHRLLPRTCPQGGDHLPPAPKTMAVPSEYDSRRPSTSSRDPEHLHLQQTVQPKSFQWNFTLEASADLFFEVGYDFLLGDLAMSLTPLEQTAATVYGKNGRDRNVLRVEDAAPGDYSLTIAEPTIHTDDVIGCNEFTFRYVAQEARPPPSAVVGLIPTDLNGVDGLGGSNRLFISGEFALTGLERGSRSRDSAITVKKQSVLRVEYDAGRGSWITASVFKKGMGAEHPIANVTRETGRKLPMVLQALLAPGDYVLQFKNRFSFISFSSTRGVATTLSIEPTSVIARANEDNFQLQCMTRYIDEPMLNAAGAYHKKYTDLLANLDQITHEKPLQSVEFVVKNESAVYFRVEYPFPAYVLSLQVIDQKRNSTLYVGSVGQNSAELSQYLKTGTYTLQVVQPEPLPSTWSSVTNLLPQCARYELSIQIDDAANSGAPVDCTAYDTLPASLNSFGITPYGSQLIPAVGHLRLYSDKFYFGGNDGNGAETTSFKITRDSVVAIYTNNDAFTDVDFQLSLQTSSTAMAPRFVSTNGYEKHLIWYIKAGEYELSIEYEGIGLEKCQNIALQILIRPFDELNAQMVCSKDTGNQAALPNKPPNPLPINFHTGLTTRLTPDYLNAHVDKEGNFAYDLDFSVAKDATVHASLAFNSLISGFELEIRSRSNGRDSFLSSGNGHPLGLSALETTLSSTLARPLFPGDYTLRIKQPRQNHTWTLGMPFDTDTMHSLCLPLMVDVCVGPAESSYLRFDPPGAQLLPIGQTLDIIVHLPEAVTNDIGVPYSAANVNKKSIQKLFKLSGNDNKPDVELKSVEYVTNVEVVGSQWKLSYEIGANEQGRTLHLEMIAKMFDLTRNPVLMCGTPEFSTVNTKCSGHGQYINDICKCEQGWAGDECQLCDTDYEDDGSGKCVKIEGGGCRHTTCQCEPGTYGVDCVPLGVCGVKAGQPTCTCRSVGLDNKSRCRHCAPGYRNWPVCSKCVDGEPCADTVPTPMPVVPGVPTPMPSIVPTPSNTATSSKAPNAKSSGGGSGGVIAGVIIAVLLLIGAGVGFYFYRKKKGGYTRVGGVDDMFDLEGHTMGSDKSVQLRSDSPDLL